MLYHEIGHVLGLLHVSNRSSLMYAYYGGSATFLPDEVRHTTLAYEIGLGVEYPGVALPTMVPALPLVGSLLLLVLIGTLGGRVSRASC